MAFDRPAQLMLHRILLGLGTMVEVNYLSPPRKFERQSQIAPPGPRLEGTQPFGDRIGVWQPKAAVI